MAPNTHSLGCGLIGYLILFATHTFVSQRQCANDRPEPDRRYLLIWKLGFPFGVPTNLIAFHRLIGYTSFLDHTLDL